MLARTPAGWTALRLRTALTAPLRPAFTRLWGDHLVIAGTGPLALLAARQELEHEGRVLLWADGAVDDPAPLRRATAAGAGLVVRGDPHRSVARLGLSGARAVLLLDEDEERNLALAAIVLDMAARCRPAGDPLAVIALVESEAGRTQLGAAAVPVARAVAQPRAVSLAELAARQLFVDWPLDRFRRHGLRQRGIFLLGGGLSLAPYASRLAAGGHFRDGEPVRIVAETPLPTADAAAAFAALAARHGDPLLVAVECADDGTALALARAAAAHYRAEGRAAPPILVRLADEAAWPGDADAMIRPFGMLEQFAAPDLLLQEEHDALARTVHEFYLEGRLDDGEKLGTRGSLEEWDDLPEGFREDNRLVADCYAIKLRDIGARLVPGNSLPLQLAADELEELARAEHERWMAAKLAQGWSHAPARDDARRLHPDIVPYDALSERIRDLDREQVRAMLRLLARAGRSARRTLALALDPGETEALPAAGIAAALGAIAAHHPDRLVLLCGLFDHAPARAAMASHAGPVRLVLRGNAQAILAALPPVEAAIARELLDRADSVIACEPGADGSAILGSDAELVLATAARPILPCPAIRLTRAGTLAATPWATP